MSQVQIHAENGRVVLMLSGALTIAEATETRDTLLNDLQQEGCMPAKAQRVGLEASQVTEIDSAGIQLLVSTSKWLEERGQSAQLIASSDLLSCVSSVLGASSAQACCGWKLETVSEVHA
jgi:anti-anti-sigma regulatory factor